MAEFVQVGVHPIGNDASFAYEQGRIRLQGSSDTVAQGGECVELLPHPFDGPAFGMCAGIFEQRGAFECGAQLLQFARVDPADGHTGNNAFHVADFGQLHLTEFAEVGVLEEAFHAVEPLFDLRHGAQGEDDPPVEHTCPHGGECAVDDLKERGAPLGHGRGEFEIACGEAVEAHVAVFLDASQGGDVRRLRVLRHL